MYINRNFLCVKYKSLMFAFGKAMQSHTCFSQLKIHLTHKLILYNTN